MEAVVNRGGLSQEGVRNKIKKEQSPELGIAFRDNAVTPHIARNTDAGASHRRLPFNSSCILAVLNRSYGSLLPISSEVILLFVYKTSFCNVRFLCIVREV
jgi:hypothetical protein